MEYVKLYEQLGYLFYAIAAADKEVRTAEEEKLREELNRIWIPLEDSTDRFGTDAAHYIFISFDYLHENMTSAGEAFEQFKNWLYDEHVNLDEELVGKIRRTASAIANVFNGKDKSELIYLAKLDEVLSRKGRR